MAKKISFIARDISWLSFNGRVLQEANDNTVPLAQRIRFLGIFSNNLDEFFRVRVATLKRMIEYAEKRKRANMHMEEAPQLILDQIQTVVLQQQNEFNRIWENITKELKAHKIFLHTESNLTKEQQLYVAKFFEEQVRSNTIPLLIESVPQLPYLREKSIYLGVVMRKKESAYNQKYALIEVPAKSIGRFVLLPSKPGEQHLILLEDVIRFNLPTLFSYFEYDHFQAHVFKVTKDAEIELDNEVASNLVERIEKGIKNRRKGKAVRFVYDKEMDAGLLEYLIRRLNLSRKDNIIPGGRIHNFRHFMDFPEVMKMPATRRPSLTHPAFVNKTRITEVILKNDVMLHTPYHSFDPVIELLRESAMDPQVLSIKITAYRLAPNSKIVNALINAVRNGKQVTVMLELKARFDEEANLEWKDILEEEGVKVLLGVPKMKVHCKLCVIKKKVGTKLLQYGFISTGNLNEKTAKVYGDHWLLTSNRKAITDMNRVFSFLENPKADYPYLRACNHLLVTPLSMRKHFMGLIDREIALAKQGKDAAIILKMNSFSDKILIQKIADAAEAGVKIQMAVRGIYCPKFEGKKAQENITAISIVDEYLEHARLFIFLNGGKPKVFISSADWMVRNLDHRVEVAVPITDAVIQEQLITIANIQLQDSVKARVLNTTLSNVYAESTRRKKIRSQIEIYQYLSQQKA
ncbi:MAG: polyphosphate kinase 1 [Bacteroidetes bacterium]|nr:MAG: polyphosphate kinase 1 [Bacteroidota bacterium]TAF92235.1 MAG: polyphosphate kinase 1 [Bacteroidota bacterium]